MQDSTLINLYSDQANTLLSTNQELLFKLIPNCVQEYYRLLLSQEETARFLDNDMVDQRLRNALTEWLEYTLSAKQSSELAQLQQRQVKIGQVHARININMNLVSEAMIVIKNCFFQQLSSQASPDFNLIQLVHNLLDYALISINSAYFDDHTQVSSQSVNLHHHLSTVDFAFEIEKMRTQLHQWFSQCLIDNKLSSLNETDFALWVRHKLPLSKISDEQLAQIEANLSRLSEHAQQPDALKKKGLTRLINDISWNLEQLAKALLSQTEKKDPLTQLYNRRYMKSILMKQTELALQLDKSYCIAMLDVDHFKQINDQYGHSAGDQVLSLLGELINQNTRLSDFAFRFGGEEFLILFSESTPQKILPRIESIAQELCSHSFKSSDNQPFTVTLSAGIAEFDHKPDYQHTLDNADQALYHAKNNGRNHITIWNGE